MFNKYLIEIKNRIYIVFVSWSFTFFVTYSYKETLFFLILKPGLTVFNSTKISFVFTNLTEIFTSYINLSFFISNQIFLIILLYHLIIFLSLALFQTEYQSLKFFYFIFFLNFFISIFFLNFFIMPYSWEFFLSYQHSLVYNLSFEPKISEYLILYKNIYYIIFYNNLILYFFSFIINYYDVPIHFRKIFYFMFFVNATAITPPDINSQIFLALTQIFFYEMIIFIQFVKKFFN